MIQASDLHTVADTIGILISLPLLTILVGIVAFAFKVKGSAERATEAIREATESISKILSDHETRLRIGEGRLNVLWDGHERRKGQND